MQSQTGVREDNDPGPADRSVPNTANGSPSLRLIPSQPGLPSADYGLCPVCDLELEEDV
jgi:hypothetical protein